MFLRPAAVIVTTDELHAMAYAVLGLNPGIGKIPAITKLRHLAAGMEFDLAPYEGARPGSLRACKEAIDAHWVEEAPVRDSIEWIARV